MESFKYVVKVGGGFLPKKRPPENIDLREAERVELQCTVKTTNQY